MILWSQVAAPFINWWVANRVLQIPTCWLGKESYLLLPWSQDWVKFWQEKDIVSHIAMRCSTDPPLRLVKMVTSEESRYIIWISKPLLEPVSIVSSGYHPALEDSRKKGYKHNETSNYSSVDVFGWLKTKVEDDCQAWTGKGKQGDATTHLAEHGKRLPQQPIAWELAYTSINEGSISKDNLNHEKEQYKKFHRLHYWKKRDCLTAFWYIIRFISLM